MKPLALWTVAVVLAFGALAIATTLLRETTRVFVVVDSSFPMRDVWSKVPSELDRIEDQRYSEFALATEKRSVHSWQPDLTIGAVEPFAPCNFDAIETYPEVQQADQLVLITSDSSCDTGRLTGWRIITLSR